MRLYKAKIEDTPVNELVQIVKPNFGTNTVVSIHSVFYSSNNPNAFLTIHDADQDICIYPIPGQIDPKPIQMDVPVTVKLPLHIVDTEGGNTVIIWGVVDQLDAKPPTQFLRS